MVISTPFKQVIGKGNTANKKGTIGSDTRGVLFFKEKKTGAGGKYKKNTSSKEQVQISMH